MSCNTFVTNFYVVIILLINSIESNTFNSKDICNNFNDRRLYVELGTKKTLIGKTIEHEDSNETLDKIESFRQCRLELISCPGCIISIKLTFLNLFEDYKSCESDYLWIYELPYNLHSKQKVCGRHDNETSTVYYTSKTKAVIIQFYYNQSYEHAFSLEYEAKQNVKTYHGVPSRNRTAGSITTPFFPQAYPKDLNSVYIITCQEANCKIRLIFTDYLLATVSIAEVIDWNGRRLSILTGLTFRPPIIISSGPALTLRFYGNGGNGRGFKANYEFLSLDVLPQYKTSCGGLVNNLGGGITMMSMVKEERTQSFDCVWIVQPSRNYLHFYTNLQVKVVAFTDFDGSAELTIHEGLTSVDTKRESLLYPNVSIVEQNQKAYVTHIENGFYIRFRGRFRESSRLAIAYTAFSYFECIQGNEFLCGNKRCIPIFLQCDGFDHCSDNSDEPSTCFQELKDRRWFHTLNFFFPKTDQYFNLHAIAIIFVICCFGLISLVFALTILIFRLNKRRQSSELHNEHLQVITELLDQDIVSIQEELVEDEDDPPVYEAPPNYDEANKPGGFGKEYQQFLYRRDDCPRCSHHRKAQSLIIRKSKTSPQAGTSVAIPESPPPAYVRLPAALGSSSSTEASTSNEQNSTTRNSYTKDFAALKAKFLQKLKGIKDESIKENSFEGQELKSHPWMSDSNIVIPNSPQEAPSQSKQAVKKINRSISFEL